MFSHVHAFIFLKYNNKGVEEFCDISSENILKDFIYLYLERGRAGKERERNINM